MLQRFEALARWLYRPPGEGARLTERGPNLLKAAVLAAILISGIVAGTAFIGVQNREWHSTVPAVSLKGDRWQAVFDGDGAWSCPAAEGKLCPSDSATYTRAFGSPRGQVALGPEYVERFRASLARRGKLWIGAELSPGELAQAHSAGANQLLIGMIRGGYRVFVDGDELLSGTYRGLEPAIVTLPMSRLAEARPLHVVVEIATDVFVSNEPNVHRYPVAAGLHTPAGANAARRIWTLFQTSRPLTLFALNILIAGLFFALWLNAHERPEYFYIALFTTFAALIQLKIMDLFYAPASRETLIRFGWFAYTAYGWTGLLAGWTFARLRRSLYLWVVPLAVVSTLVFTFAPPITVVSDYTDPMKGPWSGGMILLGALACALQAFYLLRNRTRGSWVPVRVKSLLSFAGVLALLAFCVTFIDGDPFKHRTLTLFAGRITHFPLVLLLGWITLREYRDQKRLAERTPVSEYHRRPNLPAEVRGAVLAVDLKGSEALFRAGSERGEGGAIVNRVMSVLWYCISQERGVLLQTDGDGLHAFFDAERVHPPAQGALLAADLMKKALAELDNTLREEGLIPTDYPPLSFRGGVSVGTIRPIWQEHGRERRAAWIESGSSNAFVEAARLMDLERKLEDTAGESRLVIMEDLADRTQGRWIVRDLPLTGKHGKTYRVAVHRTEYGAPALKPAKSAA